MRAATRSTMSITVKLLFRHLFYDFFFLQPPLGVDLCLAAPRIGIQVVHPRVRPCMDGGMSQMRRYQDASKTRNQVPNDEIQK